MIVCGGYLTAAANVVLRKTDVDICVVGDGEIAWVGLLSYLKKYSKDNKKFNFDELKKIKGLAFLDDNKEIFFSGYGKKLSSCNMSFPSFEYLKSGLQGNDEAVQNYFRPFDLTLSFRMDERCFEKNRRPMVGTIHVSKGCVARCTFCQRGSKGYTTYNLDDLEKQLLQLKKYNVGFLQVDDENFGSNKKYTYEVAKLLHKQDMLWACTGIRCTSVNKEDLQFYKDNGCVYLKFGIESGSQTMLDIMEKKFTVEDIKNALYSCYEIGLYTTPLGFMVGMPGETMETAKSSGKLLGEIAFKLKAPLKVIFGLNDIFYAIPLVGTPLYEYGKKLGLFGNSLEEEESYLKLVSNIGAYKRYYINLNGAPMSEVVFWDILVFLEANKTYVKLMKNIKPDAEMVRKLSGINLNQAKNPHVYSKDKEQTTTEIFGGGGGDDKTHRQINKNFITHFIKRNIAFNETFAKYVPRFLLYPFVRYALYIEYLIQKTLFKDTNNIHTWTNSKVNKKIRITDKDVDLNKTTQIERSLRSIVRRKFYNSEKESMLTNSVDKLTGGP
jgi:radical SAM superfamily enzyme YgiQ (UPF0313 family)